MRYFSQALFYISLAIDWAAHVARFWFVRILGSQKDVAGVRVILVRDGRVVLVRHSFSPGIWTLPGGGIKKNESSGDAGKREILEEVGYTINSFGGRLGIYQGRLGRRDSVIVLFTDDFEGSMRLMPDHEIIERSLFELDHLPSTLSPANRRRIEAYKRGVRDERDVW